MLNVVSISKQYLGPRGPLRILTDVNFALAPGDAAAITGPSGSGKSTLLYMLGALEPPTSGTITLNGRDPYTLGAAGLAAFRNQQVGFVFQDHCLLPHLSVLENVLVPTMIGTGRGAESPEALARTLVDQVGLTGRIDHKPSELSGGERQRVAIARALVRRPHLVLCDEPTGNLDGESAAVIGSLLLDLHRLHQTILLVVTHSPVLAARLPIRFELVGGSLTRAAG